jgi:hypothetical protein
MSMLVGCTPAASPSPVPEATLVPTRAEPALTAADLAPYDFQAEVGTVLRRALLRTEIPDRPRFAVVEYTVQEGDTPWSIGEKFGLDPETILWGNPWLSVEAGNLSIGVTLTIPPVDGVLHEVREGESVESIAGLYGADPETIREYPGNNLAAVGASPEVGQNLIIPGGRRAVAWTEPGPRYVAGLGRSSPGFYSGPLVQTGTGFFAWPLNSQSITQGFWGGHPAIDIDTYFRQPVFASDSGTVIFSAFSETGFGNLVVIDHGNGFWTYYAHNHANLVSVGSGVSQGQQIAESGSTGNSTGDHLHFGIRAEGSWVNPLNFLP